MAYSGYESIPKLAEETQNSKKKLFTYRVSRVKLDKPIVLGNYKIEYMNKAKKMDPANVKTCKKSKKSKGRKASRSKRSRRK